MLVAEVNRVLGMVDTLDGLVPLDDPIVHSPSGRPRSPATLGPQHAAGMRTDPPVSVPNPMSASPLAAVTAPPLDELPGMRSGATGLTRSAEPACG